MEQGTGGMESDRVCVMTFPDSCVPVADVPCRRAGRCGRWMRGVGAQGVQA